MRQSTFHTAKEAEYLGYLEASLSNNYGYNEEGITSGVKKLFGKKEVVKPSFLKRHGGKIATGFGGLSLGSAGTLLGIHTYIMSKAGNIYRVMSDYANIVKKDLSPEEYKGVVSLTNDINAGVNKLVGVFRNDPEYKNILNSFYKNGLEETISKYMGTDFFKKYTTEVKHIWENNISDRTKQFIVSIYKKELSSNGKNLTDAEILDIINGLFKDI